MITITIISKIYWFFSCCDGSSVKSFTWRWLNGSICFVSFPKSSDMVHNLILNYVYICQFKLKFCLCDLLFYIYFLSFLTLDIAMFNLWRYFSCEAGEPLAGTWIWASLLWTSPGSTAAGWRADRSQGGSLRPQDCSTRTRKRGQDRREGGEGMTGRQEKMQLVKQRRGICSSQVLTVLLYF